MAGTGRRGCSRFAGFEFHEPYRLTWGAVKEEEDTAGWLFIR